MTIPTPRRVDGRQPLMVPVKVYLLATHAVALKVMMPDSIAANPDRAKDYAEKFLDDFREQGHEIYYDEPEDITVVDVVVEECK